MYTWNLETGVGFSPSQTNEVVYLNLGVENRGVHADSLVFRVEAPFCILLSIPCVFLSHVSSIFVNYGLK